MQTDRTRPFTIGKQLVKEAWLRVQANKGSGGVDGMCITEFQKNERHHLYKLWNRMSSGSYFPPAVKLVELKKKDGGIRPLGIPTVADRVAQTVVAMSIEGVLDAVFHRDSYGYRANKSAHQALAEARKRCWQYDWVLDLDIRSFFRTIGAV